MHKIWSKTKFRNIFSFTGYKPEEYWTERGKVHLKENPYDNKKFRIQEQELIEFLKKIEFSSILEVGCGFGRITKLISENFPNIQEYQAIDISPDQIEDAKKAVNSDKIKFKATTIQNFNPSKKYDLVISTYMLMHVPDSEIKTVIEKMIELSSKHIVNVDWFQKAKPLLRTSHNWNHKYHELYKKNNSIKKLDVFEIPIDKPPTSLFHAQK